MSEVDRMGLIEHEIDWCDTAECDGPAIEDPEAPGTCDECGSPLVRIAVVRADAAVEEIERLRGEIEIAEAVMSMSALGVPKAAEILRSALDVKWGQSSPAGCPACSRVPGVARAPHTCSEDQS
jgi:hypothetical protein